ncbi:MAG: histone-like protein [Promethearchaeota archaeon]
MTAKKKNTKKKAPVKGNTKTKVRTKISSKNDTSRKSFISKAPIRRLMAEEGARLVSDEALAIMITSLEKHAITTTKKAIEIVKDDKRKRITAEDISWATKEGV